MRNPNDGKNKGGKCVCCKCLLFIEREGEGSSVVERRRREGVFSNVCWKGGRCGGVKKGSSEGKVCG